MSRTVIKQNEILILALFKNVFTVTSAKRVALIFIWTRHCLDGPGIEYRWGRDFPHPSRPAVGPTQRSLQWVPGIYRRVKRPGRGADHPPSSSVEIKERVELYLPSLWAFVACSRVNFTFTFYVKIIWYFGSILMLQTCSHFLLFYVYSRTRDIVCLVTAYE